MSKQKALKLYKCCNQHLNQGIKTRVTHSTGLYTRNVSSLAQNNRIERKKTIVWASNSKLSLTSEM